MRLRIDTRQLARVQVVLVHEFARARAAGHCTRPLQPHRANPSCTDMPSPQATHPQPQIRHLATAADMPAVAPPHGPLQPYRMTTRLRLLDRPYTGPSCARGESRTSCPCSADSFCTLPLPAALSSMSTGAPPGWPVHSVHRRRRCGSGAESAVRMGAHSAMVSYALTVRIHYVHRWSRLERVRACGGDVLSDSVSVVADGHYDGCLRQPPNHVRQGILMTCEMACGSSPARHG